MALDLDGTLLDFEQKYNTDGVHVIRTIQTNGFTLNEVWAEFFAEHGFLVGLSLDGTRELHNCFRTDPQGGGTYDAVLRSAALLKRYGVPYNILCVVTDATARRPRDVYEALREHRYLQFIPCLDPMDGARPGYSLTGESYRYFLDTTFALYCRDLCGGNPVSIRSFDNYIAILLGCPPENCAMNGHCSCNPTVEADGSVYPCDFYALDEWKLGNVTQNTFFEMIRSGNARRFLESSSPISEKCGRCRWFSLCRGGCRRDRHPTEENRFCECFQYFFERNIDAMMELAAAYRNGRF